jgi:hypothetical protein
MRILNKEQCNYVKDSWSKQKKERAKVASYWYAKMQAEKERKEREKLKKEIKRELKRDR